MSTSLNDKIYTLSRLVKIRESIVNQRVAFDNMAHIKKQGSKYTFEGIEATLCENKHLILKSKDKEVTECPICHSKNIQTIVLKPGKELIEVHEKITDLEKYLDNTIKSLILDFPETKFLLRIKGLGPIGSAYLLATIYPPNYGYYAPAVFSITGLAVLFYCEKCGYYAYGKYKKDGKTFIEKEGKRYCPICGSELKSKAPTRADIKKYGIRYNVDLKPRFTYIIPQTLIRAKGVYYSYYKQVKEELEKTHPHMNAMGINLTAYRVIMRLLITHYYAVSAVLHGVAKTFTDGLKLALGNTYYKLSSHQNWMPFPLADYEAEYDEKLQKLEKEVDEFLGSLGVNSEEAVKYVIELTNKYR